MPDSGLGQSEATVSIPAGMRFTVYWCPRCKIQSSKSWHFCERGHPMFPQTDVETQCVRAEVVFEGQAEYRIALADRGDGRPDYSPVCNEPPTDHEIAIFKGAVRGPPYDEVWVEQRTVTEWRRVDV